MILNCNVCNRQPQLEKGPVYLPYYEYRCNECQIGTHSDYSFQWSKESAQNTWNEMMEG